MQRKESNGEMLQECFSKDDFRLTHDLIQESCRMLGRAILSLERSSIKSSSSKPTENLLRTELLREHLISGK